MKGVFFMGLKGQLILLIIFVSLLGFLYEKNDEYKEALEYINAQGNTNIVLHDEDYQNYEFFIVSEIHGVNLNYQVKWELLMDLYNKKGVNALLLELSYTSGYLLNEYLKSGDEKILEKVQSFYRGSPFYTLDEFNFYKKLYEYNQTLPVDKRIQVIGIDIEHSDESVKLYYQFNDDNDARIIEYIKQNTDIRDEFYKTRYHSLREKRMYENILFLKEMYGIDACLVQLGAKHGFLEETSDNYKSLGYYLDKKEDSPYRNRVLNIMLFYQNSQYLESTYFKGELYYKINTLTKSYRKILINSNSSLTIVKLDYENSPFKNKLIDLHQSRKLKVGATTDYYQYIIFINNAEASLPLDKILILTKGEILKKILKLGKHN